MLECLSLFVKYYEEINFLAVGFACDVINLLQKLFTFAKKAFFTKHSFKCQNEVCANFLLLLRSRMFFFNDKKIKKLSIDKI